MSEVLIKIIESNIPGLIGKKFRSMAEGRNFIEKTDRYTSNMRDTNKLYIGRGSKAGFICEHGIYNQFIDMSKGDGKWTNRIMDDKFIETWKDTSRIEDISKWKEGKKEMVIRLFIKDIGSNLYVGHGIYKYTGSSNNGVLWSRINQ